MQWARTGTLCTQTAHRERLLPSPETEASETPRQLSACSSYLHVVIRKPVEVHACTLGTHRHIVHQTAHGTGSAFWRVMLACSVHAPHTSDAIA